MLDWGQSKNAWVMTLLDQYASIKHDVMELCPNQTRTVPAAPKDETINFWRAFVVRLRLRNY